MKILSWNVCGLGSVARRLTANELLHRNEVQIALVQELKFSSLSEKIVKEVWGSIFVNWVSADAVGSAGGFLLLWDTRHVTVSNNWKGEFSVSVEVKDLASNSKWLVTSVFRPMLVPREETYGERVGCHKWLNGAWCVGGDRNVVRFPSDKLGGGHLPLEMILFSDWINSHSPSNKISSKIWNKIN